MRGYFLTSIGGDKWLVGCTLCHDDAAVVRIGIDDALAWIKLHESVAPTLEAHRDQDHPA